MASFKHLRRRISYLPTFFSISLVLFLAGLFGMFLLHANALKDIAKQNVQLNIYFKDDAQEADIVRMQKKLENEPYVIKATFVSKDEGLRNWQKDMGESPQEMLGFNPFPNSIDVHFKPDFVTVDSLEVLKKQLEKNMDVREVTYDKIVVDNIDRNVKTVGIILLSLALLMAAVSIALINNTIRLTLYSKRFIIKSMQLVGATQGFIRRPFIYRGFSVGLLSSIFASLLLLGTLYVLTENFKDLAMLQNYLHIGILLLGLGVLGMLISGLSSYLAINKYLKMKLDDLF